ncbi:DgyrCDS6267 [Dimorphilus gyrociliatus]|uniref:DgyrCDS6267 n=1 Tax=Dimorphilus gyrociliatus TaxID=2664684 RepID=A0A7I8VMJ5_9ANNE|nr:DgyrCDS6267 [Dimorphilus gyrociliatus]
MPIGPLGEILGTTGTLDTLSEKAKNYKSKVIAPRNPKLVREGEDEFKMKPSQFMFTMAMDTKERLQNMHTMKVPPKIELLDMSETTHQKVSTVNIDEPIFQPFPSEVIFQNFTPGDSYEIPLILRNNDKVPRLVKVTCVDSPYFKIISPNNVGDKVGAGLPTTFQIQFFPEQNVDYRHELICVTEREKFKVPIRAIGARAMLDFPDEIIFPKAPVKYSSTQTILVRNTGKKSANFSLTTEAPFSVSPTYSSLDVNESMQIEIYHKSNSIGDSEGELILSYDTGEELYICLKAQSEASMVRLDKNLIRIEKTFITMANQRTITISNRSNVIANFRWTAYFSEDEERSEKEKWAMLLQSEESKERERWHEEIDTDPSLKDKLACLSRSILNRKRIIENDEMLYVDDVLKVEPVKGEIWPNSSAEITITFKPERAEIYSRPLFCDVTGREQRLGLKVIGEGVGPNVELSFEKLDVGNIFIGSSHSYEVILANKGDIDAIYTIEESKSKFGRLFSFNPMEGIVMPNGHQAIVISFSSMNLGDFREIFTFQIDGSNDPLQLVVEGSVIGQTFNFDKPSLDFGLVSFGFKYSQKVVLDNTSLVPMTYKLRIAEDGTSDAVEATNKYAILTFDTKSNEPLREFWITPAKGTIRALGRQEITVTMCSNTVKPYEYHLIVDVERVGEDILHIPITAECLVPNVMLLTPILEYGRCFLRHPYEHHVILKNDSDLPAVYDLLPQKKMSIGNQDDDEEYFPLTYTSPNPKAVIEPHTTVEIPLIVTPQELEEICVISNFMIFGDPDNLLNVQIDCIGEGPVVHISPLSLDWGTIPVLKKIEKTITLSNESLITAKFYGQMVMRMSPKQFSAWEVSPEKGEVPPQSTIELTLTACLNDCVPFNDSLHLCIEDGPSPKIPVQATGFGTTIVVDPPICPSLNLGPNFCSDISLATGKPVQRTFRLTNAGRRHQTLIWSTDGFNYIKPVSKAYRPPEYLDKDVKFKNKPPPPPPPQPVFKFSPHRMDLEPGESIDMFMEGTISEPKTIKEKLLCHAIIGKRGGKELILKSNIICEFIAPLVKFSTDRIEFRIDKSTDDELASERKTLIMENTSSLPLNISVKIAYPFQLVGEDELLYSERKINLGLGESKCLTVNFDPCFEEDLHIRSVAEEMIITYDEHPHIDKVELKGEVNFANLAFERQVIDFGCILNDTEVTRYVNMTNVSPMIVNYKWVFLFDDDTSIGYIEPPRRLTPSPIEALEDAQEQAPIDDCEDDKIMPEEEPVFDNDYRPQSNQEVPQLELEGEAILVPTPRSKSSSSMKRSVAERSSSAAVSIKDAPDIHDIDERAPTPVPRTPTPEVNPVLDSILNTNDEFKKDLGLEEIFDILPLYGSIKPGDTEQVTLTFFGHGDISCRAKALCIVEGGPTYELQLNGEASLISYSFDCLDIDFGKQMYNEVARTEIILQNTGRVGFEYQTIGVDESMVKRPPPSTPVLSPPSGYIEPCSSKTLSVLFLPGIPSKFQQTFQIQIAHLEPETVNIYAEGVFPRVSVDLPKQINDKEKYDDYYKLASSNLEAQTFEFQMIQKEDDSASLIHLQESNLTDLDIQMEIERLVVEDFATDQYKKLSRSTTNVLTLDPTPPAQSQESSRSSRSRKPKLEKPLLPEYLLDFGYVILGRIEQRVVRVTNSGYFPVSFKIDESNLSPKGFKVDNRIVRNIPGAPDHEWIDIQVTFDPRAANLDLGLVEGQILLNIAHGPNVLIVAKASVTMPDLKLSADVLDFENVLCGQCKVITVQLHNAEHVACEWSAYPAEKKDERKSHRHVPMHLRRKIRNEPKKPPTFEMIPPFGTIEPGQRYNAQLKFMPCDEKDYEQRIVFKLEQSSKKAMLLAKGRGLEPKIEFSKALIHFGPILPHSSGDEQDVEVKNPCDFPIEIYNLEYDKIYLQDEKILRLQQGYDEYETILLPPREHGEKLPLELTEYYDNQMKKLEEADKARKDAQERAAMAEEDKEEASPEAGGEKQADQKPKDDKDKKGKKKLKSVSDIKSIRSSEEEKKDSVEETKKTADDKEGLPSRPMTSVTAVESLTHGKSDEFEETAVTKALSRHLGIDLSKEGRANRNRRGIAIIVHGAPLSGKSSTATCLARKYEAALISIDQVIMEAIAQGNSPHALKARELCQQAAQAEALRLEAEANADKTTAGAGLSMEAVAAHTVQQGQVAMAHVAAQSIVSGQKSTILTEKGKRGTVNSKGAGTGQQQQGAESSSQVPSSPQPLPGPIARKLSISASVVGDEGVLSTVLPDDVVVNILSDRLMLTDCQKGIVFDGLETLFCQNMVSACLNVLKAINNRKYLYFVTLKHTYQMLKETKKKCEEERAKRAKEKEDEEQRRLEEMSEDEYDALNEEEKAAIDQKRLVIKKERLRKERERLEKEKREREEREAELRRIEEENKKKKKKGGKDAKDDKDARKGKVESSKSQERIKDLKSQAGSKAHDEKAERPTSQQTERMDSGDADVKKKKSKTSTNQAPDKRPGTNEGRESPLQPVEQELSPKEIKEREADLLLQQRFRTFEVCFKDITEKVDCWDRTKGVIRPPTPDPHMTQDESIAHPPSGKKGKKKDRSRTVAEKVPPKDTEIKEGQDHQSHDGTDSHADMTEEEKKEKKLEEGIGMPSCQMEFLENGKCIADRVLEWEKWPSKNEILDGLGLGPNGPAIPPATLFSVVPYPVKRTAPPGADQGNYIFVASSSDDPNVITERSQEETTEDTDKPMTPEPIKTDRETGTKSRKSRKDKDTLDTDEPKKGKKRNTSAKKNRRPSTQGLSVSPSATPTMSEADSQIENPNTAESRTPKLNNFRWIIPPKGKVNLRIRFRTEERGQFDQTLNFEIVGTRRKYSLYCRGVTDYPTICREPRVVFPSRLKSKKPDEVVTKKYILSAETFEFGPLLAGKSRERYKEGRYPENMEILTISNTSPMFAQVSFCFRYDSKADTYLLDPPTMELKPGASQTLCIWAYPKEKGEFRDELVCCIRDNPEPVRFKLLCYGERPELEIEKKSIQFERVLLHRRDDKTIFLRNMTRLPVKWRLSGLETLGDDFSVSQAEGIIEPRGNFTLVAYFRALKAVVTTKKSIRLEVMDVDNIIGLVQTENIQVHAEAYDVALDVSFPKGTEGGLDFETIRVNDEMKQTCTLKNKGKYDIEYEFILQKTPKCPPEVCNYFNIQPPKGRLTSSDRPAQVQVTFKPPKEIIIQEESILLCKIIEPNVVKGGEPIAHIPIRISAKSVYSKYTISPTGDINFGSMNINSKKTRTFTIKNDGDKFEFKFQIMRMSKIDSQAPSNSVGPKPDTKKDTTNAATMAAGSSRLQVGPFVVLPASMTVLPGGQASITVECQPDQEGKWEEELAIDISGRNPKHHPDGVSYTLISEACVPDISGLLKGVSFHSSTIFEEHLICKNLSHWSHINSNLDVNGIYGEDEKKFLFLNVLVGNRCSARFKFINLSKVPCDVSFSVKQAITKATSKYSDVFEIEPTRAQIPVHGFQYATVTFCPPSMQHFNATFEAVLENAVTSGQQMKAKSLSFEVSGEGNLPRITVLKPSVRNKKGQPLLLFQRILISRSQRLPLVISNDGSLPAKVHIDLIDPDDVFTMKSGPDSNALLEYLVDSDGERQRRPHTASLVINQSEESSFSVFYTPKKAIRSQAHLKISVVNNQYEDSIIQLVGEGFVAPVTLDNISDSFAPTEPELQEGSMADDDVAAANDTHMYFGHLNVEESRTMRFTMTNHEEACFRFVWPTGENHLTFVPAIGHLHSGCQKDVTVTFKSNEPVTVEQTNISCKMTKITFDKPVNEVQDWDDRTRSVKWVDAGSAPPTSTSSKPTTPAPPQTAPRPAKKKIIESEPEPTFTEVAESSSTVDLTISAICDYNKFKCKTESIHFRETLMFQTRVFELVLSNKGVINMDISWQILMEEASRGVTPTAKLRENCEDSPRSSILSDIAYSPFTVNPEHTVIGPGKKASFTIKFAPLDVNDYEARLIGSIPNLEVGKFGPVVGLRARSLMPYIHFELEDSDYIKAARRDPKLRGPNDAPAGTTLDPNTRVIEYNVIGLGVTEVRKFTFVNPTSKNFTFDWTNEDIQDTKIEPNFSCLTPYGRLNSGKKGECAFQFKSTDLGLIESFWKINVTEYPTGNTKDTPVEVSVPFLLVANVREPNVTFNKSHVNFKSLLIGHEATETIYLINGEEEAFDFIFEESSLRAPGFKNVLEVHPQFGRIEGRGRREITLKLVVSNEKEVNFNCRCKVVGMKLPLHLNVKAEGYAMNALVFCEDSVGNKIEFKVGGKNIVDFGDVEVKEKANRNVYIVNAAKFNTDFDWEQKGAKNLLSISPQKGGINCGDRQLCRLTVQPNKPGEIRSDLTLNIQHGPSFKISVMGNARLPGLQFSFTHYNFGHVPTQRAGFPPAIVQLELRNTDNKEMSVECLYESNSYLEHNFKSSIVLQKQSKTHVTFEFSPLEAIKYTENVVFRVNGLCESTVQLIGIGCNLKVEVANPNDRRIRLGSKSLRVGGQVSKIIPIVNRTQIDVDVQLVFNPSSKILQSTGAISMHPKEKFRMAKNGGTAKVHLVFNPRCRIPNFTEEILIEFEKIQQPLFAISGVCHGIEIALDNDSIPFGAVTKDSWSSRKLLLINDGDIGTKFEWDIKKFGPDFSITPVKGDIFPGMKVPFDVRFHPTKVSSDLRYDKLKCSIEGASPLMLTLTGTCVAVMPAREVITLSTNVRRVETKNISIRNNSNMHWHLRPIVDGEYFSGPETLDVDPQSSRQYELRYAPLLMTGEGKKHSGSVFFPIPDGSGLLYNLQGSSEAPKISERIQQEIPCKTSHTIKLNVKNWLKRPQRFKKKIDYIKPERPDPGTNIEGLEYIDVPADSTGEYLLKFHTHKEGVTTIKVTFINEQSGEYQYMEVTFRALKPDVIGTIELTTPVRELVEQSIKLTNPLDHTVVFSVNLIGVPSDLLHMPNQQAVGHKSDMDFTIEYRPFVVGEHKGRLEFTSNELGLYAYDLILKATAAGPQPAVYFRAALGTNHSQTVKFLHYAKVKADYQCKVDHPDFHVDKVVSAAPGSISGTEVSTDVIYEPSRIGDVRAVLNVSNSVGGEYSFPLFGTCVQSKPQGPFTVKAGSTTSINFRNVFNSPTAFMFQVDHPRFHVSKTSETIRAHKDHRVVVGFDGNESGSKNVVMAKLVISCAKSAGGSTNAQWLYYLKGITP